MSRSRSEIRTALYNLLDTEYRIKRSLAVDVFKYMQNEYRGISPFVALMSGGTLRDARTKNERQNNYRFYIIFGSLFSDPEGVVSEEQAQAALDEMADVLNVLIQDNRHKRGYWTDFSQVGDFSDVSVDGRKLAYMIEITEVVVRAI